MRAGVIGVGHLGKFHAQKYKKIQGVDLVGVYDLNLARAKEIALECNTQHYDSIEQLLENVDVVSVVTPATTHFDVAKQCLNKSVHCLVEKPFTRTVAEAKELKKLAEEKNRIIQIGHLERFNTVKLLESGIIKSPRFAECHRLSSFSTRCTDVDVILDLMIHDIDHVLCIFGKNIKDIEAIGVPVLTDKIDIAHARILFDNGAMVNLTASRISAKASRKIRLFQKYCYIGLDFQKGEIEVFERIGDCGQYKIEGKSSPLGVEDPLMKEIESFVNAVKTNSIPVVTADDAILSLEIAHQIIMCIEKRSEFL